MKNMRVVTIVLMVLAGSPGGQDTQEQGPRRDDAAALQLGVCQDVSRGKWAGYFRRKTLKSSRDSSKTSRGLIND